MTKVIVSLKHPLYISVTIKNQNIMTTFEKIAKFQDRTRELYEQKFNKADWDAKKPEAVKWYNKCKKQAVNEIFN